MVLARHDTKFSPRDNLFLQVPSSFCIVADHLFARTMANAISRNERNIDSSLTVEHLLSKIPVPYFWGYSSAGRALAWHARGQRFDPA
jgi:hypothetical protein